MTALPIIADRMRLRVVLVQRRPSGWFIGTGLVATGLIDRDLATHASRETAHAAAIALADRLDMLALAT